MTCWATLPLPETRQRLALQGVASLCQHLGGEVDHAVAGGLGPDQGPAPAQPLAGEHAR